MTQPVAISYASALGYASAWASSVNMPLDKLTLTPREFHGRIGQLLLSYSNEDHVLHVWSYIAPGKPPFVGDDAARSVDDLNKLAASEPGSADGGAFEVAVIQWDFMGGLLHDPCLRLRLDIHDASLEPMRMAARLAHFAEVGAAWSHVAMTPDGTRHLSDPGASIPSKPIVHSEYETRPPAHSPAIEIQGALTYQDAFRYAASWASFVNEDTTSLARNAHEFHGRLGSLDFLFTEQEGVLHVWAFIMSGAGPLLVQRKEIKATLDRIARETPSETGGGVFDIRTLEWNRQVGTKLEPCLWMRIDIADHSLAPAQMTKWLDQFSTTGYLFRSSRMPAVFAEYWKAHPKPPKAAQE